jgi:hypothetical protein
LSAKIVAVILFFHLFWVRIFLVENAFFRRKLGQSFFQAEYESGAGMLTGSDFVGAHILY